MVTPPTEHHAPAAWSFIQASRRFRIKSALPLAALTGSISLAAILLVPNPAGSALAGFLLIAFVSLIASEAGPVETRSWVVVTWIVFAIGAWLGKVAQPVAIWAVFAVFSLSQSEFIGRTSRKLRKAATTDPLTGINNWNGLQRQLSVLIPTCRRLGVPITVVVIDLDDFKQLNDQQGHAAGDRVLRECAEAWGAQSRAEDVLARLGGDEFLLVMPGLAPEDAAATIERLELSSPAGWCHGTALLTPNEDFHACLARADADLYRAKAARREKLSAGHPADDRSRSVPGGTA